MPAKKVEGRKGKSKPKEGRVVCPSGSESWEEHGERARVAVELCTALFTQANALNIQRSSSDVAARNSYMSGMIDMLSIARNSLGFWGADQILLEMERLNRKRAASGAGPQAPQVGPPVPARTGAQGGGRGSGDGSQSPHDDRRKATSGVGRDPMFA